VGKLEACERKDLEKKGNCFRDARLYGDSSRPSRVCLMSFEEWKIHGKLLAQEKITLLYDRRSKTVLLGVDRGKTTRRIQPVAGMC
jgi:hypothetical protein